VHLPRPRRESGLYYRRLIHVTGSISVRPEVCPSDAQSGNWCLWRRNLEAPRYVQPDPPQQSLFDPELESSFGMPLTLTGQFKAIGVPSLLKQAPWYRASKFTWNDRSHVSNSYFDISWFLCSYQTPANLLQQWAGASAHADQSGIGKIGTDRGLAFRSVPGVNRGTSFPYQEFTFKAEYRRMIVIDAPMGKARPCICATSPRKTVPGKAQVHHFRVW